MNREHPEISFAHQKAVDTAAPESLVSEMYRIIYDFIYILYQIL